jgi:hypothetical protein
MDQQSIYLRPGVMTELGRWAPELAAIENVPALAGLIHGVLLHQHWARAYGETLSDERLQSVHLRRIRDLLTAARELDAAPFAEPRAPSRRAIGVCEHFSTLAVAALRARGIPARARCGFGMYFEAGKGVDHWIVEYRDAGRWVTADFQIDDLQYRTLKLDFDVLDQPPGKFLRAGEAWRACRAGAMDPMRFGIFDEGGYWFIAQNLIRDVAALNGMEMLPWDVWGAMPKPEDEITPELFALFDRLADLTADPDAHVEDLRHAYTGDPRLRVPDRIFNAARRLEEPVFP